MEEAYAADLRKEEWGLLQARVETFHGSIWANWDQSAPGFRYDLGSAAVYLEAALSDAEGDPDGTEVAGAILKWRVGMNWKVPMPDNDMTHGWITHRSMRGAGMGQGEDGGGRDMSNWYHVWFPEGHTTSVSVPKELSQIDGAAADSANRRGSILQQYMRERAAKRKERLGKLATTHEIPHIFPNIGAVGRALRVMHPQGPAESEIWTYILVDKSAPPEVKRAMVLGRQRIPGRTGSSRKTTWRTGSSRLVTARDSAPAGVSARTISSGCLSRQSTGQRRSRCPACFTAPRRTKTTGASSSTGR